jgi:hypothetical protein
MVRAKDVVLVSWVKKTNARRVTFDGPPGDYVLL